MATTVSSSGAQVNAAAIKFCKDLFTNPDLAKDYYSTLATACKKKEYETQIIDNYLVKKGYQCTIDQVLAAQRQLPTYQLYYWSGAYSTKLADGASATTTTDGEILSLHAYQAGAQQIGYGQDFVIEPSFSNLVLSWTGDDGLNDTQATLTFRLTTTKDGKTVRSFYGSLTDANGKTWSIAGAEMPVAQLQKEQASGKAPTPPGQDMDALKIAQTVVGFVAQTTFIGLNFFMLYKTTKELQELKAKQGADPKEVAEKQKEADDAEAESDDAVAEGDAREADVAEIPDGDIANVMDASVNGAGADAMPLDIPANPPEPNAAEEAALDDAVDDAESAEGDGEGDGGEGDGGEGDGGEGEAGEAGEDSGSVLDDIGELPMEV